MEGVNLNYSDSIDARINDLDKMLQSTKADIMNVDNLLPEASASSMDATDIMMIFLAGFIGGAFSSSQKIEDIFHQIHDGASAKNPKGFLEKLLHHAGDEIDKGGQYITRRGDSPEFGLHRLFFGHDLLSVHSDNPLLVMAKQHGVLKGVLQLFRHLIADTFSKQGLPLPGHSFLDFTKANGKTGNYLVELTKNLSSGTDVRHLEAFNHLFTIRMQDVVSQGLAWAIITTYIMLRGIEDKIRISQLKFCTYIISFFTNAVSGMIKTGGLPYINWVTLGLIIKEGINFFKLNYQEIRQLEAKTSEIVNKNIELEKSVFATGANIKTFENADEYFESVRKEKDAFDDLTNFFEED